LLEKLWLILTKIPHISWWNGDILLCWILLHGLGSDIHDIWILLLQGLQESWVSPVVAVAEPILITNLNILDAEWLRVAVLCTKGTPGGIDGSHSVLKLVKSFLNEKVKLIWWNSIGGVDSGSVKRVAGVHGQKRLDAHVFAPVEVLKISETITF